MKPVTLLVSVLTLSICTPALAELPFTFQAGDPIRASELNANFAYLDSLATGGEFDVLTRRQTRLSYSGFREVTSVPGSATNGWVLRTYAASCATLVFRIDNDPEFPLASGTALLIKAGETLSAKCSDTSSGSDVVGYFMFNEQ